MKIAIVEDEKVFARQLVDDLEKYGMETGLTIWPILFWHGFYTWH